MDAGQTASVAFITTRVGLTGYGRLSQHEPHFRVRFFFVRMILMPETLHLSLELAQLSFDPLGLTIDAVVDRVERTLQRQNIEPEWVSVANVAGDKAVDLYGPPGTDLWPECGSRTRRLRLSVELGGSEGWIVQVDFVQLVEDGSSMGWRSHPLMRIKSLSRSEAWAVAAIVSRMLDID